MQTNLILLSPGRSVSLHVCKHYGGFIINFEVNLTPGHQLLWGWHKF